MGELDVLVDLQEPAGGQYHTMVLGLRVQGGKAIEQEARKLAAELPPGDRGRIKFDAETAGGVNIHRVELKGELGGQGKEIFGDNPVFVAFRDDAVLVGLGANGLAELKKALGVEPAPSGIAALTIHMKRLVKAVSLDAARYKQEDVEKAASEA